MTLDEWNTTIQIGGAACVGAGSVYAWARAMFKRLEKRLLDAAHSNTISHVAELEKRVASKQDVADIKHEVSSLGLRLDERLDSFMATLIQRTK
jgi:membrane protein implicated in regulation of membrane protease activity